MRSHGEPLVRCAGAARTFGAGPQAVVALQETSCEIFAGDAVALMGPSGSGKSTLLHLMGGLDDPTVGTVTWPGIGEANALRPGPLAMIFQGPSLLPPLTVQENVALPLILGGTPNDVAVERARGVLTTLDLLDLADKLPDEISGGQAQRVAIARAMAGEPVLILADEPTGQLDHANGAAVIDVLILTAEHTGAALVVTTHDPSVAARLTHQWEMHDGRLTTPIPEGSSWSR